MICEVWGCSEPAALRGWRVCPGADEHRCPFRLCRAHADPERFEDLAPLSPAELGFRCNGAAPCGEPRTRCPVILSPDRESEEKLAAAAREGRLWPAVFQRLQELQKGASNGCEEEGREEAREEIPKAEARIR